MEIISNQNHKAFSLKEIKDRTKMSERTIRYSLALLKREKIISETFSFKDIRNKIIICTGGPGDRQQPAKLFTGVRISPSASQKDYKL